MTALKLSFSGYLLTNDAIKTVGSGKSIGGFK